MVSNIEVVKQALKAIEYFSNDVVLEDSKEFEVRIHSKKAMVDVSKLVELKQWVIDHTDPTIYIVENVYVTTLPTNSDLVIIIESDIIL